MTRRSPLQRIPTTRPLYSIDQGLHTLQVVGSLGCATTIQLQRAVFAPRSVTPRQARARATRTLRHLFDAGFLARVSVFAPAATSDRLSRQVVHVLAAPGARSLGLDPRLVRRRAPRSDAVLGHEFWLGELGVLALESCPSSLSILHWWNDRVLSGRKRVGRLSLPIIPDALLVVRSLSSEKLFPCFLELDLGTESVRGQVPDRRDLASKVRAYLDYARSAFAADFDMSGQPIVLIVTQSDRRLEAIRSLTRELGGSGRFWFATFAELRQPVVDPAAGQLPNGFWAPIWRTAADEPRRSLAWRSGQRPA